MLVASSWGEWHKNTRLGEVISACANLKSLELAISGSSSWLKYINCSLVGKEARTGDLVGVCRLTVASQIWAPYIRLSEHNAQLPLFNIGDLLHFKGVRYLRLQGFNVRNEEIMQDTGDVDEEQADSLLPLEPRVTNVETLELSDCIWEYPFNVQDFGSIRHLEVSFSSCSHPFTSMLRIEKNLKATVTANFLDSERLISLAHSPPSTIESFHIHFHGEFPNSQKAWHPLTTNHTCHALKKMSMSGFSMPGDLFFANLPKSLVSLDIELKVTARQRENFQTDEKIKRCLNKFPGHGIRFNGMVKISQDSLDIDFFFFFFLTLLC